MLILLIILGFDRSHFLRISFFVDMQLPSPEGIAIGEYMVAVRLFTDLSVVSPLQQQSARTSGVMTEHSSLGITKVSWHEMFSFKIDSVVCQQSYKCYMWSPCKDYYLHWELYS